MFIKHLSPKGKREVDAVLNDIGTGTLDLLRNGKYDVYYEFDPVNSAFYYSALIKNKFDAIESFSPFSLSFGINSSGNLLDIVNEYNAPLIRYIEEKEESLSVEEMKEIYGEEYEAFELTRGLSPFQAQEKIALRKDFEAFLAKLEKTKKKEEKPKERERYSFRLHIDYEYYLKLGLDITTQKGVYEVDNLYRFVEAYKTHGTYKLSKDETIVVEPNAFTAPYDSALNILCNNLVIYHKYKISRAEFNSAGFVPLIETLAGETVVLDGKKSTIEIKDPVTISLGKKGEPIFTPPINKPNSREGSSAITYLGENGVILSITSPRALHYYPYGSDIVRETYRYFNDNSDKNFDYIKDIFSSKLLPKVTGSLKVTPKSGQSSSFLIRLYIAFDEQERLTFKSVYEENGKEVKRKEIQGDYSKSLLTAYDAVLTSVGGLEHGHLTSQEEIYDFLTKDLTPLTKVAQIYFEDRLKGNSLSSFKSFNVSAKFKNNFLELSLDSSSYSDAELLSILSAIKKKKKFVLLKGKTILLDGENLDKTASIFDEGQTKKLHAPLYHLFSLESNKIKVHADESSKAVLREIKDFKDAEVSLPESISSILRPYQVEGVKYLETLSKYNLGGILADEMGLGKTVQTIAYLVSLNEDGPILIVCPKAVLYNWLSEINRFSSLDATIVDGNKAKRDEIIASIDPRDKHIYLASYDSFRRDSDNFSAHHFSAVILDEAQSVKNAFSQRHMALEKLNSSHRFALTGTPLENSPLDLWSIFDFLMPGYLGGYEDFIRFSNNDKNKAALASMLKPFTLRRRKDDVLKDLPPKTETNILLSMEDSQRLYYVAYLRQAREEIQIEGSSKIATLAALTRLRQICVDPSTFIEEYSQVSSKLSYCKDMLMEAKENGHKVLVFSSFKSALLHLNEILEEEEIRVGMITGDTSGKDRLEQAKRFNDEKGDIDVMLVSLKAGGVGLNLVGADTVIHLDPWWNPAAESQASDRAHRIGQTRPVTIFRLISKDSIEEKVQLLQEKKKDLFEQLIEGSGGASKLSDEDIAFLLS